MEYDNIVLSTGSAPIIPRFISNVADYKNLMLCKNYKHGKVISEYIKNNMNTGKSVAVIGGGYIGIELCEAFLENGFKVNLIEGENRIMKRYFDEDFTQEAEKMLKEKGLVMNLGKIVNKIENNDKEQINLTFADGSTITMDAAVMCIGFRPNTDGIIESAKKQNIKLDHCRGAFLVDKNSVSSVENVYAIGDCACCHYNPSE